MTVWIVCLLFFKILLLSEATIYTPGDGCFCNLESVESPNGIKNPQLLFIECLWPYKAFEKQLERSGSTHIDKGEIDIRNSYTKDERDFEKERKCLFNPSNRTLVGMDIKCVENEDEEESNELIDHIVVKRSIKPSPVDDPRECRNFPPIAINDCKRDILSTVNLEMKISKVPFLKIYRSTSALCNANFANVCYLEVITSDDDEGVNYSVNELFNGEKCAVKPKIETVNVAIFYFTGYDQLTGKLPFAVTDQLELSSLIFKNITLNQLKEIENYLIETQGNLVIKASCDCHALWLLNVFQERNKRGYAKRLDTLNFCEGHQPEDSSLLELVLRYFNEIEPEMPSNPMGKFAWQISQLVNRAQNIDFKSNCTDLYYFYNNASNVYPNYTAIFFIIVMAILNYFKLSL